jgi:hypothetical protein
MPAGPVMVQSSAEGDEVREAMRHVGEVWQYLATRPKASGVRG